MKCLERKYPWWSSFVSRDLKGEVFVATDYEAQAKVALQAMEKDVTVLVSQINCLQV